uniref:Uncharacterized protein n=1 Tax=Meloidogyne enterolobii TaxID=390850 RepID=A0A6V7TR49_MELEN|nr:unnamed protein product [Meloidogyne enterolobii]
MRKKEKIERKKGGRLPNYYPQLTFKIKSKRSVNLKLFKQICGNFSPPFINILNKIFVYLSVFSTKWKSIKFPKKEIIVVVECGNEESYCQIKY